MELRLRDVTVSYPGFRLGPITISFTEGLHAILGPNGAGKTTLLKAVAGLVERRGWVQLDGVRLDRRAWRLISGNLAEPPEGFDATLYDYARVYLGRVAREWRKLVEHVFSEVDATWMLYRRFEELSLGQRSLALTLIAIARPSPLLLLDEPFAHLDPYWRCRLVSLLQREASRRIVLYTTHEFDTPRYADTLVLIRDGSIVASGRPREIMTSDMLAKLYDARFVAGSRCVCIECGADERRAIHRDV